MDMPSNKSAIRKEMGCRVRALRRARGLSIDELSAKLALTPSHLGLIERGERGITVERLMNVCQFFGCSADFLITGKGPVTTNPDDDSPPSASIDLMLNSAEREKLAELLYLLRG
jgi:transcriptional regulator with XRE-family HTH domain